MNDMTSVRFELTEEEKNLLREIARNDRRISMSAVIRQLIIKEAKTRGLTVSQPQGDETCTATHQ